MENDILDSLTDLGYDGPLSDEVAFSKALDGGPKSLEFTKLVHILAEELKKLLQLEETVNMMTSVDESSSFLLELSSFLKELGCPYKKLVVGHMSARLQSKEDRLLLLDYLVSELMAARMQRVDCPKEKSTSGMDIIVQESPTAKNLKDILIALKFNKPPPNITPEVLFAKLEAKLKDTIQKDGEQLVGKPLYNKAITEKDWKDIENVFTEMFEEYRCRRETLITRLECTIQSFEWSDRLKTKKDVIQSTYRPKREQLKVKPDVRLSDFLAARTSLLQVEKTSSVSVRKNTRSDVNKVVIGQVPDRGGRPNEQQPPPPEMPSWQQRTAGPQVYGIPHHHHHLLPTNMMTEFKDSPLEGTHGEESRPLFPAYSGDNGCQKSDSKDLAKLVQIPTASPSDLPTASPSDLKTASPSDLKTASPSDLTTASPSDLSTALPSDLPTASPSDLPTASPSDLPNGSPSDLPTASLSDLTTASLSDLPTASPSDIPTASPSDLPTASLSDLTTASPSDLTTASPSDLPTASPSDTVIPLQPWTVVLQKRPKKGTKQKGRPQRSRNSRARRKALRLKKQIAIAAETQRELPSTSKVLKAQSVMIPPPHIPSISKVATMVQSVMIPSPYMPSTSKVSTQTQSLVKPPPSPDNIPSSSKVPPPTPISKVYTEAQSVMTPSPEYILSTTKLPPASPEHIMPSTSKLPPLPPRPKPISNVSTEAQSVMIPPPPEHIPFSSKLAPTTPISNVSTEAQNVIIPPPPECMPSNSKLAPPMPISKVSTKAQSVMIPPPTDHMPSTSKLPPPPTLSSQSKRQTPRGKRVRRTASATPEKQPGIVPSKKRPRLETKSRGEAKRTKTTANPKRTVIDQSQLELQIAVTTVPQGSLSSSQARQLQDAIVDSIVEVVLSPSQTVLAPSFRGRPYLYQGALAMWCENDYTRDWLENALKSIPSPIPDTTLVVVKLSDLKRKIRAGLLLHTFITDATMIQKVLCSQNPWYQVDTWQCLSMSVKEGDGHRHLPPKYKEVYRVSRNVTSSRNWVLRQVVLVIRKI